MNFAPLPSGAPGRRRIVRRSELWYDPGLQSGDAILPPVLGTTATVAQQVGAQGEQLVVREQVSTAQLWFAPEVGVEQVPIIVNAPPPRSDTDLSHDVSIQQHRWLQPVWYPGTEDDVDGPLPPPIVVAPYDPTATAAAMQVPDATEQTDRSITWFGDVDLLGIKEIVLDATPAQIDAEWQDFPQQQDVWLAAVWWWQQDPAEGTPPVSTFTTATVAQQAAVFGDEGTSRQQAISTQPNWVEVDSMTAPPVAAVLVVIGGTLPAVLIEAATGDIYLSIGGNLILNVTTG